MGENIKLSAQSRLKENDEANKIRKEDFIPAVIYGKGKESRSLKVPKKEFNKVYLKAGESNLIELTIDNGVPLKTLVYGIQREPVKGKILHVDFFQVDMKQKLTTEIPLNFIGVSKAVEFDQGSLVKVMDAIEVECLPDDLVNTIDVDISPLEHFDDVIKIEDIKFPTGMTPTAKPDETVANVMAPAAEEKETTAVPAEEGAVKEEKTEDKNEKAKA